MNITEVRVKLMRGRSDRLRAFCSITIDDDFVVHDLRVIEGRKGFFVAMPSRKLTDNCPKCGGKNELRAKYCNECGNHLGDERARRGDDEKIHVDVAHPIHTDCREHVQQRVLDAYDEELARVKAEEEEEEAEEEAAEATGPGERASEEEYEEEEEYAECEEAPGYAEEVEAEEEEEYEALKEETEEVEPEEEAPSGEEAEVEEFGPPLEPEEPEEAEEPTEARGGAIRVERPPEEIMEKEEETASALESSLAEEKPYPGPAPYEEVEEVEKAEEPEQEREEEEEEEEGEAPKPSPDRHERREGGFGDGIL